VGISAICQSEYSSELIHGEVTNIANFEFWRLSPNRYRIEHEITQTRTYLSAHLQFHNFDLISNYRRFIPFIEGDIEHLGGFFMELVGKPRPVEGEATVNRYQFPSHESIIIPTNLI
jgi:hypothetical protein